MHDSIVGVVVVIVVLVVEWLEEEVLLIVSVTDVVAVPGIHWE